MPAPITAKTLQAFEAVTGLELRPGGTGYLVKTKAGAVLRDLAPADVRAWVEGYIGAHKATSKKERNIRRDRSQARGQP